MLNRWKVHFLLPLKVKKKTTFLAFVAWKGAGSWCCVRVSSRYRIKPFPPGGTFRFTWRIKAYFEDQSLLWSRQVSEYPTVGASHRWSADSCTAGARRRAEGVATFLLLRRGWSPCRKRGRSFSHISGEFRETSKKGVLRLCSAPAGWLRYRRSSSVRPPSTCVFLLVCFWLGEYLSLRGVFPLKSCRSEKWSH